MAVRSRHDTSSTSYQLVYILGSGRCGSTLLDLILNGHSRVLGAGELMTLNSRTDPLEGPHAEWNTELRPLYIQFWHEVERRFDESGQSLRETNFSHPRLRNLWRLDEDSVAAWALATKTLLASLHQASGRDIIIDTSKAAQRLYLLLRSGLFRPKVIHLLRDGRAVSNSYIQRYGAFWGGLQTWAISGVLPLYLRRRIATGDWLEIRYEELATNPETVVRAICAFLGVEYEPQMLHYRNHAYYGLEGSPTFLKRTDEGIELDERWRSQFSLGHRLTFALLGGWLNRLYGYRALL
jgi:Sulfotransferase family